jgi:two-component system chemotaxis response regulator CheY
MKTLILVVSEEKSIRSLVRHTLTEADGFQAEFAADAVNGLDMVTERHRMALVEFDMAEMNGLEFLQRVRMGRSDGRRNLSVGVLTGFADHHLLTAAIALDLNTLLLKPLSPKDLMKRVTRMMTDDVKLKSPEEYEEIPIPTSDQQRVAAEIAGRSVASVLMPPQRLAARATAAASPVRVGPDAEEEAFGPMRRRPIKELKVGWQIGRDILGPSGTRLVGAGTILTPRLLSRLRDLMEEGEVTEAWVRPPLVPS